MSLIVRQHDANGTRSEAVYSPCERYRYALTRVWDDPAPRLLFIMLNPSTATELANDPTIERCERRARSLGYGAFRISNLFALRETNPARLKQRRNPSGPENAAQIDAAVNWCDRVLCAWGVHGALGDAGPKLRERLRTCGKPLLTLGLTKDGHPRHPLYVAYAVEPGPWNDA